jgi:hypothetical protein
MRRPQKFVALIIYAMSVSACTAHSSPTTAQLEVTLASLNLANPAQDATRNFRHGDLRPVGINGYTCAMPKGAGVVAIHLAQKYGLRCLTGTSDAIVSHYYAKLRKQAVEYAVRYNLALAHMARNR